MKKKKYIHVTVTRANGTRFENHLMLKEAHLLTAIMKENACIEAYISTTTPEQYKQIFG